MERPIGIYVHHHGSGHARRARQLAACLSRPVHILTSATDYFTDWPAEQLVALPLDFDEKTDITQAKQASPIFHYLPRRVPGIRQRMGRVASWIAENDPVLLIVDLSVEIAHFARLCSVPTIYVRLHGRRDDLAHREVFRLCEALLAPFPPALEDEHTPAWVREKTIYLGAFSRYDRRSLSGVEARHALGYTCPKPLAVVINGRGGDDMSVAYWGAAARATPTWEWLLVGQLAATEDERPANLCMAGYQHDTYPFLRAADVVIGSAGTNTLMEIGAASRPYISLPEPRPFDEQYCKARALEQLGLTLVQQQLPTPGAWAELLAQARLLPQDAWATLWAEPGLAEAAARIEAIASRFI